MTSNIVPYLDDENTPIAARNGPIKSFRAPMTKRLTAPRSEPRPLLSDASNGKWSSRGVKKQQSRQVVTDKVPNRSQKGDDDLCQSTSHKFPALNLIELLNETTTGERDSMDNDEIGIVPPNDDVDFPDDFEDIWPVAERPTLAELKWLVTWDICTTGNGSLYERKEKPIEPVLSWDDEDVVLPIVEEEELPTMELEPLYEDETLVLV